MSFKDRTPAEIASSKIVGPPTPKSVTRADLAVAISRKIWLSHLESKRLLDMVLEEIGEALIRGENVKLVGFGAFHLRSKAARLGRNPKTRVEAAITARKVLVFKASLSLRKEIA